MSEKLSMKSQCCNANIEELKGGEGLLSLTTGAYICSACKKYCVRKLQGGQLAGGNPTRGRVEDDFYATPEEATKALLRVEKIIYPAWEPACGAGHISKLIYDPSLLSTDLKPRGYGETIDFLADYIPDFLDGRKYRTIITNPPFNLFQEFAEQALKLATDKVILFGKIQALEGQKRATFMQNSPLKTVYVFKKRINPLRNGSSVDENGKKWASTMAFAWYVWEKGYTDKPTIEWI